MHFWAICIVCLYVGIELFNWVTGLHWLADFALPMSVLAGIGLAIASNTAPKLIQSASTTLAADTSNSTPLDAAEAAQPTTATAPPAQPRTQAAPSISFTINKNIRP
ncbi:hypothetical protein [Adonisia turfae]|uniref:Uncharacterized protein n=1 Tax=Adonisia turfae CCMR0081 TaxID=2292702 RepID=A0A6M0RY19_9CYAN|nr:hypothetical protein [Adonisia turfae]NEZ60612.1 hypothetical protein [Adonisia turfae CCMR0081]